MVSYTTVSPLPALQPVQAHAACRRSVLCGTGLRVTPSGRYPPPCSAEPGRSSSHLRDARPPGQPIRCPFYVLPAGGARTTRPFGAAGGRIGGGFLLVKEERSRVNWTAIIIWLLAIVLVAHSRQDVDQDCPPVRTRRPVPAGPGGRGPDARPAVHHPGGGPASAGEPADRDNADPVTRASSPRTTSASISRQWPTTG